MDEKPWWKSLGEWAAIAIPFAALILPMIGQAELGKFITSESVGITEWLTVFGTMLGAALAFYGRWRATTKLTK